MVGILQKNPKEKTFHFFSGGAIGFDQIAFKVVEMIKKKFPNLIIINEIDVPFKLQYIRWRDYEIDIYLKQLDVANKVVMVDTLDKYRIRGLAEDVYHPAKMQKRNEYMVDMSDTIVALWNGDRTGGTWNCLKYARKQHKEIINLMWR